ncbi:hypothetical protein NVP1253O_44 [Vibrio phage 1.253.O._10N.286.45.B12]|nr:hypothetical protein NVP1235O_44 [Vibrio phage 1.235.O._10N.261.52.B2]AUR98568.1 hypothetical protein NVP1253O_44 [Vibrio phage 1.253.O._10N.286.45.B12]
MIKMLKRFLIVMSAILVFMWADVRFFSEARGNEGAPNEPPTVKYKVEFVNANKVYEYDDGGNAKITIVPCDTGNWTIRDKTGTCYALTTNDE